MSADKKTKRQECKRFKGRDRSNVFLKWILDAVRGFLRTCGRAGFEFRFPFIRNKTQKKKTRTAQSVSRRKATERLDMSEAEAAVLKLICANHGSMSVDDLEESVCVFNVRRIISNREKFVCCRSGGEHKVVAKTELRLCKAKVCQGCNNLHLCRKFLRGCQLPHQLRSDHNVPILVEHGLQELDRAELCTLLLQNDNFLLPPICFDYNNGGGQFGLCKDGDDCDRLHICEQHLQGDCFCSKAHDFDEPQPLKALQARGVPNRLLHSLKSVYINKEALRGNRGNPQRQPRVFSTSDVWAAASSRDAGSDDGLNKRQTRGICLYFVKGHCKYGEKCPRAHNKLPYRWELRQGQQWNALPDSEEIERDYCNPEKTYSNNFHPVYFDTMTRGSSSVRRLSTASSVLHPNFVLTTEWLWYWEDESGNWNLYASAVSFTVYSENEGMCLFNFSAESCHPSNFKFKCFRYRLCWQ
uniref:C3H1-type domain-containing protein n=1 Tax=Myripristis murdjan TaxID=586833 RepID=A0A667WS67_9TELE